MKYYEVYDATGERLLAHGNSRECMKILKCKSMDSFYALVNRSIRGINKKYKVIIRLGGDTEYPVLGKYDPVAAMSDNEKNEFGNWMRMRRKKLGITQKELAEAAGITCVSVNRYETGRRLPGEEYKKIIVNTMERMKEDGNAV